MTQLTVNRLVRAAPSTTSPTTLFENNNGYLAVVAYILWVNKDLSTHTLSIEWGSGSTWTKLTADASIGANTSGVLTFDAGLAIENGQSIRVTASAADVFDITAGVMDLYRSSRQPA